MEGSGSRQMASSCLRNTELAHKFEWFGKLVINCAFNYLFKERTLFISKYQIVSVHLCTVVLLLLAGTDCDRVVSGLLIFGSLLFQWPLEFLGSQ